MARGGGGKRRTYVRDANGRFASTAGGGGGLGAARKAARSQSGRASTLQARTSLKRSRAKLAGRDPADQRISATLGARAQKGAVTRGNRKLATAKGAAQTRLQGPARVGTIGKTRPSKQPTSARPINQGPARTPAAQRPGSMTSILGGTMRAMAQTDARRVREIEAITGQKVRPTAAGAKAGKEAGARVRATAKGGKVANTLRAGLRELAQSDARAMREMAQIVKDATPKVAGGKERKALPAAKAEPVASKPTTRAKTSGTSGSPRAKKTKNIKGPDRASKNFLKALKEVAGPSGNKNRKAILTGKVGRRLATSARALDFYAGNNSGKGRQVKAAEKISRILTIADRARRSQARASRKVALSREALTERLVNKASRLATLLKTGPKLSQRQRDIAARARRDYGVKGTGAKPSATTKPRLTSRGEIRPVEAPRPAATNQARRKPLKNIGPVLGRNLPGFKGLPIEVRTRKQSGRAYRQKTNQLGKRVAGNMQLGSDYRRVVAARTTVQQGSLFGGVKKVAGASMRRVGERVSDGTIRRDRRSKRAPLIGSKAWRKSAERQMRSGTMDPWVKASYERLYGKL